MTEPVTGEQTSAAANTQTLTEIAELKHMLAIRRAKSSLIDFIKFMMPDPDNPDDPTATIFEDAAHHRFLCEAVERSHRRDLRRFAVSIPPQHGKSTIISRYGIAWRVGMAPRRHRIIGTYNQTFAEEIGQHVREIIRSPRFKAVFPEVELDSASQSKSVMKTRVGGKQAGSLTFVGRGVATTGRPADEFTIDDPYKDKAECDSDLIRRQCRDWYSSVVFTRLHALATIMIVHTRWNEDDLIGWLCDPEHPEHNPQRAQRWTYINVPAVVKDPKLATSLGMKLEPPTDPIVIEQFGDQPMAALWPTHKGDPKFPLEHLAEAQENDSAIFSALYLGKPSPEEGNHFKVEHLVTYSSMSDLPSNLRKYGASDHAVSMEQGRDRTCLGCVGVDENDDIWVLPDLVWRQMETDTTVAEMLRLGDRHKPIVWWAEKGHISKSIGPFLKKRMIDDNTYFYVEEVTPSTDKKTRTQSIHGRMAQKKVHFPAFAHWWPLARSELLKFPNATHDDFVDWLAHIGMGLAKEVKARPPAPPPKKEPAVGTIGWVKWAHNLELKAKKRRLNLASR